MNNDTRFQEPYSITTPNKNLIDNNIYLFIGITDKVNVSTHATIWALGMHYGLILQHR